MGMYEDTLPCGCTGTWSTLDNSSWVTPRAGCTVHRSTPPPSPPPPIAWVDPDELPDYVAHEAPNPPRAWVEDDAVRLRISFQTRHGTYRTVTFVCDTGAAGDVYLDADAWAALEDCWTDDERPLGRRTIRRQRATANLAGVRLLASFGMRLHEPHGVAFDSLPSFVPWM